MQHHKTNYGLPSPNLKPSSVARLFCWFVCFLSGCGQGPQDGSQRLPGPSAPCVPLPGCRQAGSRRAPNLNILSLHSCSSTVHSVAWHKASPLHNKMQDWEYRDTGKF